MILVFVISGEPKLVQARSLYSLIYSKSYDIFDKAKQHLFLGSTIKTFISCMHMYVCV